MRVREGCNSTKNIRFQSLLFSRFGVFVTLLLHSLRYSCDCTEFRLSTAVMDPTVASSLVCGINQVIDFSTKVVKKCHELYRDGVSSENEEAEEMANHLTDLRAKLDLPDESVDKDLLDLGSKCSSTAKELIAELEKLKVDERHRKRQSLNKSLKAFLKKNSMEKIQKRLEGYQKLLDSRILVDLRFVHYKQS